jgi:hypothetical protein
MIIFVTHHQKCKKKPLQYHTGAKIAEVNYWNGSVYVTCCVRYSLIHPIHPVRTVSSGDIHPTTFIHAFCGPPDTYLGVGRGGGGYLCNRDSCSLCLSYQIYRFKEAWCVPLPVLSSAEICTRRRACQKLEATPSVSK